MFEKEKLKSMTVAYIRATYKLWRLFPYLNCGWVCTKTDNCSVAPHICPNMRHTLKKAGSAPTYSNITMKLQYHSMSSSPTGSFYGNGQGDTFPAYIHTKNVRRMLIKPLCRKSAMSALSETCTIKAQDDQHPILPGMILNVLVVKM